MEVQRLVWIVEGLDREGEGEGGGDDVAPTWTCSRVPVPLRSEN